MRTEHPRSRGGAFDLNSKAMVANNNLRVSVECPTPNFEMSASEVILSEEQLVQGVLDKAHFGASSFGLVLCLF